jgi:hypothetical protein
MRSSPLGHLLALLVISACCNPEPMATLSVPRIGQETSVWCWAASGEMVMDFLGTDVSQCDQANKRFGRTDCCNTPRPSACVSTGWPEFEKYDFTYNRTSDEALTWNQLKSQIGCKGKPVAFSWRWSGGGGHMMVVRGYVELNGTNWVYYNDPLPVDSGSFQFRTYADWVSGAGYTHWDDFYDITKQ